MLTLKITHKSHTQFLSIPTNKPHKRKEKKINKTQKKKYHSRKHNFTSTHSKNRNIVIYRFYAQNNEERIKDISLDYFNDPEFERRFNVEESLRLYFESKPFITEMHELAHRIFGMEEKNRNAMMSMIWSRTSEGVKIDVIKDFLKRGGDRRDLSGALTIAHDKMRRKSEELHVVVEKAIAEKLEGRNIDSLDIAQMKEMADECAKEVDVEKVREEVAGIVNESVVEMSEEEVMNLDNAAWEYYMSMKPGDEVEVTRALLFVVLQYIIPPEIVEDAEELLRNDIVELIESMPDDVFGKDFDPESIDITKLDEIEFSESEPKKEDAKSKENESKDQVPYTWEEVSELVNTLQIPESSKVMFKRQIKSMKNLGMKPYPELDDLFESNIEKIGKKIDAIGEEYVIPETPEEKELKEFKAKLSKEEKLLYENLDKEEFKKFYEQKKKYEDRIEVPTEDLQSSYSILTAASKLSRDGDNAFGSDRLIVVTPFYNYGLSFLNSLVVIAILLALYAFIESFLDDTAVWFNEANRTDILFFRNPRTVRAILSSIDKTKLTKEMSFRLDIVLSFLDTRGIVTFGFGQDSKQGYFYVVEATHESAILVHNQLSAACAKSPDLSVYRYNDILVIKSRGLEKNVEEENYINFKMVDVINEKLDNFKEDSVMSIQSFCDYRSVLSGFVNQNNEDISGTIGIGGRMSSTWETIPKSLVENSNLWVSVPWGPFSKELCAGIHKHYEFKSLLHAGRWISIKPFARLLGLGDSVFLCNMSSEPVQDLSASISKFNTNRMFDSPLIYGFTLKHSLMLKFFLKCFTATALFSRNVKYESFRSNSSLMMKAESEEGILYYGVIGNTFIVSSSLSAIDNYTKSYKERSSERVFPVLKLKRDSTSSIFSAPLNIEDLLITGKTNKGEFELSLDGKLEEERYLQLLKQ